MAKCKALTALAMKGLTSNLTHYRSFRRQFYRPDDQINNVKVLKETSWSSISGFKPSRTTPPCYNNTTLGNHLYAQRKGPSVTNPICWTCKNCSHKCAADCEHCHTIKHRAVLIIFPQPFHRRSRYGFTLRHTGLTHHF